MHKLPSALKCYDTTDELQAAIDSKLTAIESAFSNKFADHEAKFTKIVEDKLIDHEIKLNKMVEDFNSKHDNLLASKSDASESRLSKIAEDISLTLTNHCKQVETSLACASSDNSMETASPMSSTNLSLKDVEYAVSSVLNEEKEKSKRKLNLILHNIPESDTTVVETRKQHNTGTAMAIINQHLSIPASISNVVRLGKRTEDRDKPRLLRITVDSDKTKAKILLNCTKIRNIKEPEYLQQVYITPDLTFKEREENKLLRSKLAEINNGQKKYRIKNGEIVLRGN